MLSTRPFLVIRNIPKNYILSIFPFIHEAVPANDFLKFTDPVAPRLVTIK